MARLKTAVFLSGRGSNFKALLDAAADLAYPAEIVAAVSDRPDAAGLDHARAAGLPAVVVDRADHPTKAAFEAALDAAARDTAAEAICLAGFMRLVSADFCAGWGDRLLNIHPSLLPAYRGLDTHVRALADGVRIAGCTVHIVRPAMDAGPILAQAAVPVAADDTADSLAARVLAAEHRIYPMALAWLADGRVTVTVDRLDGGAERATIADAPPVEWRADPPMMVVPGGFSSGSKHGE